MYYSLEEIKWAGGLRKFPGEIKWASGLSMLVEIAVFVDKIFF